MCWFFLGYRAFWQWLLEDRQRLMWVRLRRGQVHPMLDGASAHQPWSNWNTSCLLTMTGILQQNTSLVGTDRDNIAQLKWWLASPVNVWSCCAMEKVSRVTCLASSCAFPNVHEKNEMLPQLRSTWYIPALRKRTETYRDNNSSDTKEINNSWNDIQPFNAAVLFLG